MQNQLLLQWSVSGILEMITCRGWSIFGYLEKLLFGGS